MKSAVTHKILGFAVALAFLTACASGGNGGGVPSSASSLQGASSRISDNTSVYDLSGYYTGTFHDGAYGTGKAVASYSQYQNGVGGILTIAYPTSSGGTTTVVASVALAVSGSAVDGSTVAGANAEYCTFSTTSTYDYAKKTMTGKYMAVAGCTGDSGSFTLHHHCTYKGSGSADVRSQVVPKSC